jgi:hypothetical protein
MKDIKENPIAIAFAKAYSTKRAFEILYNVHTADFNKPQLSELRPKTEEDLKELIGELLSDEQKLNDHFIIESIDWTEVCQKVIRMTGKSSPFQDTVKQWCAQA